MGKNNIVLVGLKYDSNLGDQAIFLCMKNIVRDCIKDTELSDCEIREMDMTGDSGDNRISISKKIPFRITRVILGKLGLMIHSKKLIESLNSYVCRKAAKIQCNTFCDEDTKAIIFAGGGIIKFKYQNFHDYIYSIVNYAEKKHIPVMISAAGVEGYDESNNSCQLLKEALNKSCVKSITTRDDILTLEGEYCKNNSSVRTALVADPVCSMSKYFPINNIKSKDIIGLGVVREGLFIDNDIEFHKEDMLAFWSSIYREIVNQGYQCKIFCNGLDSDYKFALDLINYLGLKNDVEHVLLDRPTTVETLAKTITSFSGVITGRLHASIIAYSYNVPSVGLVWNEKQVLFGKAIGFENRFFKMKDFDPKTIVETIIVAINQSYDSSNKARYCQSTYVEIQNFCNEI